MDTWHRQKCDELDILLRQRFAHHEQKKQQAEAALVSLRRENERLNGAVTYLTTELDSCRETLRAFKNESHDSQRREQALALQHQQLMRKTELELFQRAAQLDAAEAELQRRLSDVVAREKDAESVRASYEQKQATLDAAMTLAEKQVQADLQRAQELRARAEDLMRQTDARLSKEQAKLTSSDADLQRSSEITRMLSEEAVGRTRLERMQLSEQREMCNYFTHAIQQCLSRGAARNASAHHELCVQREIVALKERELHVKFRREQEALTELVDRQSGKGEDFKLECQSIIRQLKALATDLSTSQSCYPDVFQQLADVQEKLDSLYFNCTFVF